jgi:hypothetical protein
MTKELSQDNFEKKLRDALAGQALEDETDAPSTDSQEFKVMNDEQLAAALKEAQELVDAAKPTGGKTGAETP